MRSILRNKKTILCFLLPALLVYLLSVIVPILWSGYYSLFDWNGFSDKEYIGFANFAKMLGDTELWDSIINTLVYTFFQIILQVGGGLVLAMLLTKIPFFRRGFQTLYYLPVIVSTVALCQMFKKIFAVTPVGLFNDLLSKINPEWIHLEWLSNPDASLGMVIFTSSYKNMPIYMLIFFSALLTVPHSLKEAARIDGANSWQIFLCINLPHIRPTIVANILLVLNGSLREFDIPKLLTSGGPMQSSQTQALYMYKQAFTSMQYGYGSAIAMFIVIEALIFAVLFRRFSRQRGD